MISIPPADSESLTCCFASRTSWYLVYHGQVHVERGEEATFARAEDQTAGVQPADVRDEAVGDGRAGPDDA